MKEASTHVEHVSGEIPQLFQPGTFNKALARPAEGSLLHMFDKPGVKKADVEDFMARKWFRNLGLCTFDESVCPWTYVFASLVLPHGSALDHAEYAAAEYKKSGDDGSKATSAMVSKLTDMPLKGRADYANAIRRMVRRVPHLLDYFVRLDK